MVDVMKEPIKMTLLTPGRSDYLADHYTERNERPLQ